MEWLVMLLVALVGGGLLSAFLYSNHLEKKRRQRVIDLAKELQLELNWQLSAEDQSVFAQFQLARKGHQQRTNLSLVADDGTTRICLFDYSFVTGGGKNQQTHHWVVSLCRDEDLHAPPMQLKPSTFLSKIGSLVGFQDIDIPEDPVFSKAFVVQGDAPERIQAFLDASRRAAFLQQPKLSYALNKHYLLIVRERKKLDAPFIKPLLSESLALTKALSDQRSDSPRDVSS